MMTRQEEQMLRLNCYRNKSICGNEKHYSYDANGERIIKKSELGETQYVSANYIVRNKTVISKHVFAGNQRIASTVSMKNNCGTMTEQNTMYFHPDRDFV